jgi:hypothetical protein
LRKILDEPFKTAGYRTSETIYGLIRITDDADVGLISGQKSDQPVLAGIDILEFIDKKNR